MALFMSERQYDVGVRNQKKIFSVKTGEQIDQTRRVFAEFRKGGIPDWALAIAEQRFLMAGKPPEISPTRWLSTYDSVTDQIDRGWTDEERALIEKRLRAIADIVEIELPKLAAPWPTYDKLVVHGARKIRQVVDRIVSEVREGDIDPNLVIAYERQELNRPEVVAALTALLTEGVEEEELVEA